MTSISGSDPLAAHAQASLEAFERAAESDASAVIDFDGEQLKVLGRGSLPSGRGVTWVDSSQGAGGVARVFAEALSERFGARVANSVARELGLDATAGKPIESRTVKQAIDMARTASSALDGSSFATQLKYGATTNSAAFRVVASELGLAPERIDGAQRDRIDQLFAVRLREAGQPPSDADARAWLAEAIQDVTRTPVDGR